MKLLSRPTVTIEEYDFLNAGGCSKVAGRRKTDDVKIVVEDELLGDDQLEDTFRTLKYGPMPDLADAMHNQHKVDKIVFEKDNLILYGVLPRKMERTATFKGRIFTCTIDHFEVMV